MSLESDYVMLPVDDNIVKLHFLANCFSYALDETFVWPSELVKELQGRHDVTFMVFKLN